MVEGLPQEELLLEMMNYIFRLEFKDEPHYDYIVSLLKKCIVNMGRKYDKVYDW